MHRQQPQPYYGAGAGNDKYGYNDDDNYSYPPPTGSSKEKGYAAGGLESPDFLRQPSTASSTNTVASYDEKKGYAGTGTAGSQVVPVTSHDPDPDYIPPAIPRYPNGRPGVGSSSHHHPKSSVSFQPGHVSRGSVALLAAAEGKIPKKEGLKMWRSDEHHGTFTRGGKRRTCVRCCCCTIIFAIILVAGIVAAFLLWVRPPNVQFQGVLPPQDGTEQLVIQGSSFNLNFDLDIAVSNPNFFGASFKSIAAKAYYPGNDQQAMGGGEMRDVKIPAHSHNTLFFPFNINYTQAIDPNRAVLLDMAEKCGFVGDGARSDIKVNYDLTLQVKIVVFTISPTFSSSTSFACPLSQQDISGLLGDAGISGLTGGGSS